MEKIRGTRSIWVKQKMTQHELMDGSRRKLDPLQQLGVQALEDTPQKMGDPHLTSRLADAMA